MVLHGDASQASSIDPLELSRRSLTTRAYLFHLAPHLCGDQEACQVSGLMYVGLSSHRGPRLSCQFAWCL